MAFAFLMSWRAPYRIVHLHCLSAFSLGALLAARLRGARTILTVCTTEPRGEIQKVLGYPLGRLLWRLFRSADAFIAMTPAMIEHLRRHGVPESKICLVPHMVGLGLAPVTGQEVRARARRELHLPERPTVLFAGRLCEEKGVGLLLSAWPQIVPRHPATLALAGEGPLTPAVRKLREQPEMADFIRPLGWLSDPELAYRVADLFVFPSSGEAFGIVLAEAMMCGLPVLTTPVGLAQDWIRDGENGFLLPRKPTVEDVVEALCRLLDDRESRDRVGRRARRVASALFAPQPVLETYGALCRHLLSGREGFATRNTEVLDD